MGVRGEIFSSKVMLPNRTYFFNVKENRMGDIYLNIVESKNRDNGGFDRQSVILFADDLQEFLKGFDESLRVLEKSMREKRQSGKVSAKHDERPIRERSERSERNERGERGGRSERGEREERGRRGGRDQRPMGSNRSERGHQRERNGRGGERNFERSRERTNGRSNERGVNRGPKGSKRVVVKKRD
jgi:hypothetical protein